MSILVWEVNELKFYLFSNYAREEWARGRAKAVEAFATNCG